MTDPTGGNIINEYTKKLQSGFTLPSSSDISGTEWHIDELSERGYATSYTIRFDAQYATIIWNDGIDVENHEYPNAAWSIENKDGFAILTLDLGNFEGIRKFILLIDKENDQLFIAVDITGPFIKAFYEPDFRTLNKVN